jgi:hypothetical protein
MLNFDNLTSRNMKKVICGNEMDRMPNWAFKMMAFMFEVADVFKSPGRRLDAFLNELSRITKPDGVLILEDGHQPRSMSKTKVINSGCWEIISETKAYMMCQPKK